jgi:hypothetical protein
VSGAKRKARSRTRELDASREAKRLGSAILEVLGGLRSPTEASELLGISPQRYYKLEARAVQGLLQALETPADRRRRARPDKELASVEAERDRLRRELQRAQALVRIAQRHVGLPAPKATTPKGKGGKRKRKPRVRARRLADELREEASVPKSDAGPTQPAAGKAS